MTPEQIAADSAREAQARADEDAKLTPEEKEARLAAAVAARDAIDTTTVPVSRLHTYPDGSQRVGTDPFPELSPLQEADAKLERVGVPADERDSIARQINAAAAVEAANAAAEQAQKDRAAAEAERDAAARELAELRAAKDAAEARATAAESAAEAARVQAEELAASTDQAKPKAPKK